MQYQKTNIGGMIIYLMSQSSHVPTFPILKGENVKLRQLCRKDAKRITKLLTQEVSYYLKAIIPNPYKIEDALNFINKSHSNFKSKKGFIFGIDFRRTTDELSSSSSPFVGIISIENIDYINRNAEVGYWIGKEYWNRAIATESLALVIDYAFNILDLHKLYASVFVQNAASIRVLEKCSLRREGELCEQKYKHGKFHNILLYGMTKNESGSNRSYMFQQLKCLNRYAIT
jgi:RimJ/RimL family protein N-acetyltransferase